MYARGGRREKGERGRRLGEGSGRKRRGGEEERGGAGGGETQAGRRRVEAGSGRAARQRLGWPRGRRAGAGVGGVGHRGSELTVGVVRTPAAGMLSDSSVHISCSNDSPPCST